MPWKETDPVNERLSFIAAYQASEDNFSALCERFGISRKSGYKWLDRYHLEGPASLEDRSSAPLSHPHAVGSELCERIIGVRKKHPRWGPKKIRIIVAKDLGLLDSRGSLVSSKVPAASTIGEILRRNGLSARKKRVRRSGTPYDSPLGGYEHPNAIWCADFKGHFAVRSGVRCHPLTTTDGYSRKLLRCEGLRTTISGACFPVFEAAFREFGLPDAIRTDNGPPFSSLAAGGLSQLAIWWIRLGIHPERIEPGRPDQNGRHERMHRTLKAETAKPPRANMPSQQRAFDEFQKIYNQLRPHEALGMRTPDSHYRPSLRTYPKGRIPHPEYPDHFRVFKTYPNGVISFGATQWMISGSLKSQRVGLEPIDNDRWKVYFGPIVLGTIDQRETQQKRDRNFGIMTRIEDKN